jgi:tetratricopeptide (TPR) repeat protein
MKLSTFTALTIALLSATISWSLAQAPVAPPKARLAEDVPTTPKVKPADEGSPAADGPGPKEGKLSSNPEEDLFTYAHMLYKREAFEIAAEQFGKFLESYPRGKRLDAALTYKGICHMKLNQADQAMAAFGETVKRVKSGPYLAYCASQLGILKLNDSKRPEAAILFGIAATNADKPDDKLQYRYYQGVALRDSDKPVEAQAAFEAAMKITGTTTPGATVFLNKSELQIANYLLGIGKKTLAMGHFEKLAKESTLPAIKAEAAVSAGLTSIDLGKNKEAIPFFESVAKMGADAKWSSLAKFGLIRAAYAQEQWAKVTEAWRNLDIKEISAESRPQLLVMVGNAYRVQEQYARAIDIYSMVQQYFPDSKDASEAEYRKLVCLYKLKDPRTDTAAEEFITRVKQSDPNSEFLDMARLMRAEDSFAKKKWEMAAKSYMGIRIEKIPEELRSSMLYRKGWAEAQNNQYGAAIDSLTQFINLAPKDPLVPQALVRRAQCYLELKDLSNAIKEFDAVVDNYPDAKEAEEAFRLGGLLRGQDKNYEGMIQRLTAMLVRYPNSKYKGECKFWIGTGLYGLKKWKECLDPLSDAQKLFPEQFEDASVKVIVALTYLEDVDSLGTAVDAYLKTNPKTPINGRILEYLGSRRYSEKNHQAAAKYLGLATSSAQSADLRPITWFQLSEARLNTGDFEGVLKSVAKLLDGNFELPTDTKAKAYYFRGKAHLAMKQHDDAKTAADAGLKLRTQDINEAHLYFLRGENESARGNDDEAAGNYVLTTQLVLNDPVAAEAYRRLVLIFRKSKQLDKAAQFLELFRTTFPKEAAAFEKDETSVASKQQ